VLPDVPAIPDDGKEHAYEDTCLLAGERTVFAAWPHMHQIGSWISVSYGDALLAEVPDWDFGDQRLYFPDPVTATDATATVSCRYVNPPGNGDVPFGLFSEEEMCVAFLYYYPAGLRGCS